MSSNSLTVFQFSMVKEFISCFGLMRLAHATRSSIAFRADRYAPGARHSVLYADVNPESACSSSSFLKRRQDPENLQLNEPAAAASGVYDKQPASRPIQTPEANWPYSSRPVFARSPCRAFCKAQGFE